MNNLNNKVIVVTGGNGLLGRTIIQDLKAKGAITVNLEMHVQSNLLEGVLACDITQETEVKDAINIIVTNWGKIDGWVNNAYPRTADWGNKFEDVTLDSWKKNVDLQLNSIFICSQAILELMKKQGSGSLVNISSIYGLVGPDFTIYDGTSMTTPAAYSAIKGGVVNFSRYLAAYYGPYGLRINCISPGGIFDHQNPKFVENYEKKVPMRRMGIPSDIAGPVSFLMSEDASYITGHNLLVDGGWTAI